MAAELSVLDELKDINTQKYAEVKALVVNSDLKTMNSHDLCKFANQYFVELNFLSSSYIMRYFFDKFKDDAHYLYNFGYLCFECGFLDLAEQMLKRSVDISPETEFRKYFILGEMCKATNSAVALQLFQKGITLEQTDHQQLTTEVAGGTADTERGRKIQNKLTDRNRTVSQAYCTVAEILMNVPEFPKNKKQVDAAILHAEAQDPTYLEPIYQKAFLHFNLADEVSCRKEITRFVEGIQKIEEENDEDLLDYPAEMLVGIVRMMIEGAIWEDGAYIAEIASTNDHSNYEAIYMHAFCSLNMEDLDTCRECLDKLKTFDMTQDTEIMEAIAELKEEYTAAAKNNGHVEDETKGSRKNKGGMDLEQGKKNQQNGDEADLDEEDWEEGSDS